jgi:DNA-binding SARP family transcriptional activator
MAAVVGSGGVAVGLLGPFTLVVDGVAVPVGSLRRRAVLAALAASSGAAVRADRVAEAIWSDTGRPASRSTLQVHVHQARQLLGPHSDLLRHTPAGYRLDGIDLDVRTVEERLRQGRVADRAGDAVVASAHYRAALALWRGQFCADLVDLEYFRAARALYETLRLDTLEATIAAELRIGVPGLAAELDALVREHPLRERLWGQLMVALYKDGQQAAALAAYRRARAVLADEVGIDPGAALRHLERAILDQAGTTALLRVVAPAAGAVRRPGVVWLDPDGAIRHRALPAHGRLLIGRDPAADIVVDRDGAASRRHAAVVVEGGTATVRDLASRNGTFHNGRRIDSTSPPLRPGDLLRCGDTVLAVTAPPSRTDAPSPDDETRPPSC